MFFCPILRTLDHNSGLLSDITLSNNLYKFYILLLNSLTNPSTNVSFIVVIKCVIYYILLELHSFMLPIVTLWSSQPSNTFIVFLTFYLLSFFMLVFLYGFLFSNINHTYLHTFLHSLLLLSTNSIVFLLLLCLAISML